MSEDLSDNIDLCGVCIHKSPSKRGFIHDLSHDMVKVEETLHDFHFPHVVTSAKTVLGRVKNVFRSLEASGATTYNSEESGSASDRKPEGDARVEPTCACCNKRVTTPCWACVICGMPSPNT